VSSLHRLPGGGSRVIWGVGMKIAVGSDERTHVTDAVVDHLRRVGVEVELHGPLNDRPMDWVDVGREVGERVASGACQQGVLFCWTGTGVSIAANKVVGIRAALCNDAETARGARKWNDANVLAMSLRSTPEAVAKEIVDAWLETEPDEAEREMIAKVEHPRPSLPRSGREN
jgi:ribose 5-phosphate isomerase B